MNIFGNVMHFVLVKTERYISNISKVRRFCSIFLFVVVAKLGIKIQSHISWLKQVNWKNAFLDMIRAIFIKNAITQLIMGLSEKLFCLNDT